ncbi:MAG: pyruvate, phosphate dikinase [Candidatus Aenigmatarchaeota archaeon]
MKQYVYFFGEMKDSKTHKDVLGGKGANLGEMTNIGIPVPPGFTITTEACKYFYDNNKKYPSELQKQIDDNLKKLEQKMGKKLGVDLLVSVRSGAAASMPGMMDTILNLGLNDKNVMDFAKKSGNERFVWDAYRRLLQMFGDVVMGVEHKHFEEILSKKKETKGVEYDTDLDAKDLKNVVDEYKKLIKKEAKKDFPQDAKEQLKMSIDAVFGSWMNKRAITYRRIYNITGLIGTAVNIQTMVFGNMGQSCGTGVAFTRNPSTGDNIFYGEYLMNAQGEDVVAGIRTPKPITELKKEMPKIYSELVAIRDKLEKHYREMQDVEFTIENGKLFMLQTRNGKRTGPAAVKIAVDMVKEKLITEKEAIMRVEPSQLDQLLHKRIDEIAKKKSKILTKGLAASPGAAVGNVVFTAEDAVIQTKKGDKVILVRPETSPEDIEGMNVAQGILTATGGLTSHAAVVARGMGKCCVSGAGDIIIDVKAKKFRVGDIVVKEGDEITLDGSAGEVFVGTLPTVEPNISGDFATLMKWSDSFRKIGVRTNADTPRDTKVAVGFGAEGIGLCRTEHMFFEGDRIRAVREMILSRDVAGREKALAKLLPMQRNDFYEMYKALDGRPMTIRLIDPPLHEFLPKEDKDVKELSKIMNINEKVLREVSSSLHEFNPMLGHRGCRLCITYPEIAVMQTRAIIEAAAKIKKEGKDVHPEIMIPLVGHVKEFVHVKDIVEETVKKVMDEQKIKLDYSIGTMIEVPRAAITADEVAKEAEFFSFGTNDLTQMTFGFSRDDVGKFMPDYIEKGVLEKDPFQTLDTNGVGQLIKIAIEKGRKTRPNLKVGICGEHGGDPDSVKFCANNGFDYVSCSPYRVPIARLAAAQAELEKTTNKTSTV